MNKKTTMAAPTDLGARMIRFVISDDSQDRDEDIMLASGCDFTNFAKNPQFLGFHNYYDFPLGVPKRWWIDGNKVMADVYFPTVQELSTDPELASEKARLVDTTYCMYKAGMLSAVSIGFQPVEMSPNPKSESGYGKLIKKWELYEFSAVPVPANPNALAQGIKSGAISAKQAKQWEDVMEKGALPFHKYPLADPDTSWDGPAEVAAASVDDLKKMCAWVDPENEDVKSGYKLPHHTADGYKTVKRGVMAAMGAVLGARGGVSIPDSDKEAVKAHLAKHYAEFDLEVPGDKAAWEMQLKSEGGNVSTKAGKRHSAKDQASLDAIAENHAKMEKALTKAAQYHQAIGDAMKSLLDGQDEPDDDSDDDQDDLDNSDNADSKSVLIISN
jgi:hypothetical protein